MIFPLIAKDKAKDLVEKLTIDIKGIRIHEHVAAKLAIVTVKEILISICHADCVDSHVIYWRDVLRELKAIETFTEQI